MDSIIRKNGQVTEWLGRANEALKIFNLDNLQIKEIDHNGFMIGFYGGNAIVDLDTALKLWVNPVFDIWIAKKNLLTSEYMGKLDCVTETFDKFVGCRKYLSDWAGRISWSSYLKVRENAEDIEELRTYVEPEKYVEMLKSGFEIVKNYTDADVVFAGVSPNFANWKGYLETLFAHSEIIEYFDFMGIHLYDDAATNINTIEFVRGLTYKPICATETGWSTSKAERSLRPTI